MKSILDVFRRAIQNPKTTATGCAMIAAAIIAVIADPASLATLPPWLGFLGGAGLILAPDAVKQIVPAIILVAILAAPLQAQVTAMYTPEPMAVMSSLGVKSVGLWSVRVCNDGAAAVTLPEERVYMAAAGLRLITPARARAVLLQRQAQTPKARAVRYIKYGLIASAGLTGFGAIAATPAIVASLASGAALAGEVQRNLELEIPSIAPFSDSLLEGSITLPPGACTTRTAFAAKMKSPQAVTAQIAIPAMQ